MSILEQLVQGIQIPKMARAKQVFPRTSIKNIPKAVRAQICRKEIIGRIKKGDTVAITVGSRGISNLTLVIREIINVLKEAGANPFIVPTMGSHGGATAEGQAQILYKLGFTEDVMGVPIRSTMEVARIGTTENGLPVYFDKYAAQADATIVVGRIKPHTSFRGLYESGLAKMIVIGLGKQAGAEICHATGLDSMAKRIEEIARFALDKSNIVFGVGLIENAYDELCKISAIQKEKILDEEPSLLVEAKNNLPQILLGRCDVLIVDEIGKNISGTGMDPNIVKRFSSDTIKCDPLAQRIVVRDLTEETHGNANGIGLADICTKRAFNKMDFFSTYPNPLTSKVLVSVKVPMVMENDSQAIRAAIKSCFDVDYNRIKMIRIKNTLKLDEIYISDNLMETARGIPGMEIFEEPKPMEFDVNGDLM